MWTATEVASPYRDIINWETSLQTAQLVWQKCMIVPWCCGWTAWISNLWPEELICNSNLAITTDEARLHNFPEANWATTQSTQMKQLKCRPYMSKEYTGIWSGAWLIYFFDVFIRQPWSPHFTTEQLHGFMIADRSWDEPYPSIWFYASWMRGILNFDSCS